MEKIFINRNVDIIKVKLRQIRTPIQGDKFASRHAQKGTIGLVLEEEFMPYSINEFGDKVRPDIIFNPHHI